MSPLLKRRVELIVFVVSLSCIGFGSNIITKWEFISIEGHKE